MNIVTQQRAIFFVESLIQIGQISKMVTTTQIAEPMGKDFMLIL